LDQPTTDQTNDGATEEPNFNIPTDNASPEKNNTLVTPTNTQTGSERNTLDTTMTANQLKLLTPFGPSI